MATNYVESEENYRAKMQAAMTLGIDSLFLGMIMKENSKSGNGHYSLPDSRKRAEIARDVYRRKDSKITEMLKQYEIKHTQMQKGERITGLTGEDKICKVCGDSNPSMFDACPVCLDVYIQEFRRG